MIRRLSGDLNNSSPSLHRTKGNQFSSTPIPKISTVRKRIFFSTSADPSASYLEIENASALPTANRKNGKTRSVGVQPSQGACFSGAYTYFPLPGVLTSTIPAMVIPRKMSRARNRFDGLCSGLPGCAFMSRFRLELQDNKSPPSPLSGMDARVPHFQDGAVITGWEWVDSQARHH